jgi:hypothetical protein
MLYDHIINSTKISGRYNLVPVNPLTLQDNGAVVAKASGASEMWMLNILLRGSGLIGPMHNVDLGRRNDARDCLFILYNCCSRETAHDLRITSNVGAWRQLTIYLLTVNAHIAKASRLLAPDRLLTMDNLKNILTYERYAYLGIISLRLSVSAASEVFTMKSGIGSLSPRLLSSLEQF